MCHFKLHFRRCFVVQLYKFHFCEAQGEKSAYFPDQQRLGVRMKVPEPPSAAFEPPEEPPGAVNWLCPSTHLSPRDILLKTAS